MQANNLPHLHHIKVITGKDLMESACQNDEAEKAFTEYVHDKNFSITYIVQSGFCHGKKEGISLI